MVTLYSEVTAYFVKVATLGSNHRFVVMAFPTLQDAKARPDKISDIYEAPWDQPDQLPSVVVDCPWPPRDGVLVDDPES